MEKEIEEILNDVIVISRSYDRKHKIPQGVAKINFLIEKLQ